MVAKNNFSNQSLDNSEHDLVSKKNGLIFAKQRSA